MAKKPHKNVCLELIEALNERPEVIQVQQMGEMKAFCVKGDWQLGLGYKGHNLDDNYIIQLYHRTMSRKGQPPLLAMTIPGYRDKTGKVIVRQQVAMLPLTVLLERLRVPPPDEEPWGIL